MVEDFKLPFGKLKAKNGKIFQLTDLEVEHKQIDPGELKSWMEEATKPRFKVVQPNSEIWSVVNNNSEWIMASFFKEEGFDAKKEAKMLCERLNRSG